MMGVAGGERDGKVIQSSNWVGRGAWLPAQLAQRLGAGSLKAVAAFEQQGAAQPWHLYRTNGSISWSRSARRTDHHQAAPIATTTTSDSTAWGDGEGHLRGLLCWVHQDGSRGGRQARKRVILGGDCHKRCPHIGACCCRPGGAPDEAIWTAEREQEMDLRFVSQVRLYMPGGGSSSLRSCRRGGRGCCGKTAEAAVAWAATLGCAGAHPWFEPQRMRDQTRERRLPWQSCPAARRPPAGPRQQRRAAGCACGPSTGGRPAGGSLAAMKEAAKQGKAGLET